jgi:hypothetical protein
MPRFWLGRSAAGRLLGPRNHGKGTDSNCPPKQQRFQCLREPPEKKTGKLVTQIGKGKDYQSLHSISGAKALGLGLPRIEVGLRKERGKSSGIS